MSPPAADELELSVFGKGVGECLVVHLGDGDWMVVDSFLPSSGSPPVALWYLKSLGVPATSIKLVVATHWDDDHIRGLRQVLANAPDARLVTSGALQADKFLAFVAFHQQRTVAGRYSSGTREFVALLDLLRERNQPSPTWAGRDSLLWAREKVRVTALSPSPASVGDGFNAAGVHPEKPAAGDSVRQLTPNGSSVVLWVEGGPHHRLLLGADLECATNDERGWGAVLMSQTLQGNKALTFKVPHHGAKNADDERIWDELLEADPQFALTRYTSSRLPSPRDRERLRARGGTGHLAGRASPRKRYDAGVARQVRSATRKRPRRIDGRTGHVRFRLDRTKANAVPDVHRVGWVEDI